MEEKEREEKEKERERGKGETFNWLNIYWTTALNSTVGYFLYNRPVKDAIFINHSDVACPLDSNLGSSPAAAFTNSKSSSFRVFLLFFYVIEGEKYGKIQVMTSLESRDKYFKQSTPAWIWFL